MVSTSAHRLNLRLLCTEQTPMKHMIEAWLALPIVIMDGGDPTSLGCDAGNVTTALEYSGRVSEISLPRLTTLSTLLRRVAAVVQVPYIASTSLELSLTDETAAVLPDSF